MEKANMLDYLRWRGDLSFTQSAFNDVDSLILSQIIYIPFEGIVPTVRSTRTVTLKRAAEKFFGMYDEKKSSLGALLPKGIFELFKVAAGSRRFENIRLMRYVNKIDHDTEIQFCAVTIVIDEINEIFIDFRGTDDTIVGWKEDFNMGFMTPVPSQTESVVYFNRIVDKCIIEGQTEGGCGQLPGIRLAGHSKGGNLAVYAATYVKDREDINVRKLIQRVYNFDGPGFDDGVIDSDEYNSIRDKIRTFVPQSSVVGMLLGHKEDYTVVRSNQVGLLQHDALSWEVMGTGFVCLESVTDTSLILDQTLKAWIAGMDSECAERFVNSLFEILNATDAKTLTELVTGKNKSISIIMKAYAGEDEDTKKMLKGALKSMLDIWKRNIMKNFS